MKCMLRQHAAFAKAAVTLTSADLDRRVPLIRVSLQALLGALAISLAACDARRATDPAVGLRMRVMTDSSALVRGARSWANTLSDPAACSVDPGVFDVSGFTVGSYPVSLREDGSVCSTTVISDPATPYPLLQSSFGDREQMNNLGVTFSRGVGTIHISGAGAIKCTNATFGTAIAYSADSLELGRADLTLIDPSDCSPASNPDDMTFGAEATLAIPAGVRRIIILPPQPWYFDVLGNDGFVTAFYTISFVEADGPRAHVRITADSSTLAQGDTTVFRTTAPGASQLTVTSYRFVPVTLAAARAVGAVRAVVRQGAPATVPVPATAVPVLRRAHFMDAALDCSVATVTVCYDDPQQTGYEVVAAMVDGEEQRDSVLVTVTSAAPALQVSCPTSVSRGDQVACNIGLTNPTLPFDITEISVGAISGMSAFNISIAPPGPMAAGAVYSLSGPGVASSTLTVRGRVVLQGSPVALTKTASFAVLQRPVERDDYVMTLSPVANGPGRTSTYPSFGGGTLGLYRRVLPSFDDIAVATAASGPNKGLSYVLSIPGIPASLIFLTFAMFPGDPWYEAHPDQSGPLNDLGQRICTKSQIDGMRLQVERHEGSTMARNSHFGIDQDLLRRWKLGAYMGSHVLSLPGSAQQIRYQFALDFAAEFLREDEALNPLQAAFDLTDNPASFNALGCSIFLKI